MKNDIIRLTPFQATTHNMGKDFIPYAFNHWFWSYSEITYNVYLESGIYEVGAEYAAWYEGGELYFTIDGVEYTGRYRNTGNSQIPNDLDNYITDDLGGLKIVIPTSKFYTIKITRNAEIPNVTNWINVRSFILKKQLKNSIPEMFVEQTVKIYDLMGRYVKTVIASKITISTVKLPSGIYIAKGERFAKKIIIGNNNSGNGVVGL